MTKDEMINCLLRNIESDRFRVIGSDSIDSLELNQAITTEWSRLAALTYGEIEALYFKSEGLYALST